MHHSNRVRRFIIAGGAGRVASDEPFAGEDIETLKHRWYLVLWGASFVSIFGTSSRAGVDQFAVGDLAKASAAKKGEPALVPFRCDHKFSQKRRNPVAPHYEEGA
jgi:hypothetical protein